MTRSSNITHIKKGTAWIVSHFFLGLLFLFFYKNLVITDFYEFNLKLRNLSTGEVTIKLPDATPYLLKIWCRGIPTVVTFNQKPVPVSYHRHRPTLNEFFYIINKEMTKKGENLLWVTTPYNYSMRMRNNFANADFGICFLKTQKAHTRPLTPKISLFFMVIVFFYGWIANKIIARLLGASLTGPLLWAYLCSFLPLVVLFTLCYFAPHFSPFSLYFFQSQFISLTIWSVLFFQFLVLAIFFAHKYIHEQKPTLKKIVKSEAAIKMKGKGYEFIKWWLSQKLSDRFLLVFIFSLANSTFCMIILIKILAEIFANLAFIFLVLGVIAKWKEPHGRGVES